MESLYNPADAGDGPFLRYVTLLNAGLAVAALGLWTYIGPYLAEPMSAATRIQMQGTSRPDFDNPTYALMWLAPLAAIVLSQAAKASRYHKLSRWIAAYPLVMIGICLVWYFGFSADYR
jgi:hypothetical protein